MAARFFHLQPETGMRRTRPVGHGLLGLPVLAVLSLLGCFSDTSPTAPAPGPGGAPVLLVSGRVAPNRYIITLRPSTGPAAREASRAEARYHARVTDIYDHALHGFAAEVAPADLQALRQDPAVALVEPDQVIGLDAIQSVPSWGLDRINQRSLPLDNLAGFGATGAGVHIYIIDTGILLTHTQFGGRASFGFDAIKDGNGQTDCHGHGTHVAGTAAGATYGIAKAARLHSVRVLDCNGFGLTSQVIAGVNWVTANRIKPAVANMSLGGGFSATFNQAVTTSIQAGITYTIAAGNSNLDACTVSPASTPNAITVAASDILDQRAGFSNFGPCVDLFGPGVNITSAWRTSNTATMVLSGTSMAAPHAAGVAALYLQTHPAAPAGNVRYALLSTATAGVIGNAGLSTANLLLYTGFFGTTPSDLPPIAGYDFTCAALACDFNSQSSIDDKGIVARQWTFGDGSTGTGVLPHHDYAVGGGYSVTLTVSDAAGQTSQLSRGFTLPAAGGRAGALPVASFTAFPNAGTVDYDATGSTDDTGIGSYHWDFGDGKAGTGVTVRHVYAQPNQFYTATLTVYDVAGQSATASIQVYPNSN